MKRKSLIRIFIFAFVIVLGSLSVVQASNFKQTVETAKDKKSTLESKKKEIEGEIAELENEKKDIVTYITKLDAKVAEINDEISSLERQRDQKNKNLEKAKKQLKKAKEIEAIQYDTMRKRIKYMYENGKTDYIDIILCADNISDLLNRAEYIEKISEYDQTILEKYQKTKQDIAEKEKKIQIDIEELEILKEQVVLEQNAVTKLLDNKKNELVKYNQNIAQSESKANEYAKAIEQQEQLIENLLEQERKRIEEERKKQEQLQQSGQGTQGDSFANQNGSTNFRWPLQIKGTITSYFGSRPSPTAGASSYHKGIDIGAPTGTPIVAANGGEVVTASYQSAAGNYVMIYHGGNVFSVYMHCSKLNVSVGQVVKQGDVIGYVGSTGVSTGPHLHFGISINGSYVNPLNYVSNN